MNYNFRTIRAEEVEVRPAEVKGGKATLLLYQDARCAMNILDSAIGPMLWQKEYFEANGLLFCKIGIFDADSKQWIWKSDTGSRSNIEEEKGLASDAFKRAAVAWGIGRELYTAPRISIELTDKDLYNNKLCQSFHVGEMKVEDGVITYLTILDKWGKVRFNYSDKNLDREQSIPQTHIEEAKDDSPNLRVKSFCTEMKGKDGVNLKQLESFYRFYTKPSKDDPNKSVAEAFRNFEPQRCWDKWISKTANIAA